MIKTMKPRSRYSRWAMPILGFVLLASCGASSLSPESRDSMAAPADESLALESAEAEAVDVDGGANPGAGSAALLSDTATVPTLQSALVKQANLSLTVDSVDDTLEHIAEILTQQQGDLLALQDEQRFESTGLAYVFLELRVPKDNLDATLSALKDLGTIDQQSITATEVSDQLVDLNARLRNLRKSEESLLKIMERSGSIPEVLEVSRELSALRASIEQIDAQLKALQARVAYSTITLQLTPASAPQAPTTPLVKTLGDTWQEARDSVGALTVGLLKIGLWLLAYSPYLIALLLVAGLGYRLGRRWLRSSSSSSS